MLTIVTNLTIQTIVPYQTIQTIVTYQTILIIVTDPQCMRDMSRFTLMHIWLNL